MDKIEFDELVYSSMNHLVINQDNIAFFLQVLKETDNRDFWLILPLELCKTGDKRLVPILAELLEDSRTVNYRGNFLTALAEYDYSEYIDLLVKLLNDNWEVRNKAADMLVRIQDNLSIEKKSNLKDKILNSLNSMDEKCSFLCDVCGELDIEV